jgi:transcriptional regulator with XRE-family HTH domain
LAHRPHEGFQYPGDEVIYKALGEALRNLRRERGLSLEQAELAFREALTAADPKGTYRALGLTVKEHGKAGNLSRQDLSRKIGLSLRNVTLAERGHLKTLPPAYFFRLSYALKVRPDVLARRFEAIQKNMNQRAASNLVSHGAKKMTVLSG